MPSEPTPPPAPEPEETELRHPPLPHISEHTGGLPALDMTRMSGVREKRKKVCGKCADCLVCKKRADGAGGVGL